MRNLVLFDRGNVASIFKEILSDGKKSYNVRIYDLRLNQGARYVEVPATDEKHAIKIFELLNDCVE